MQRLGRANDEACVITASGSRPSSRMPAMDSEPSRLDSASPCAGEQIVVRENGHGRAQRLEELDLHRCVGDMVFAANDVRDAHIRIVGDACEGVERGAVLADQHGIGDGGRVDFLGAANEARPKACAGRSSKKRQCGLRPWASNSCFSSAVSLSAARS